MTRSPFSSFIIIIYSHLYSPLLFHFPMLPTSHLTPHASLLIFQHLHIDATCLWMLVYSYLNASTGFLVAALIEWKLAVSNAIPKDKNPAMAKIHQLILVL